MMEELLTEVSNRFVLFPIKYQSIWNMYKKAESAFWTAEEIDLTKDYNDWEKLSDNERHFLKNILAFFAGSDGIVNENLTIRFMNEVKPMEAKSFYGFQVAMENIHCVARDTLILTDKGYEFIFHYDDKYANVWNGKRFSKVLVQKTSSNSKLIDVILSNGMTLLCTEDHKWLIKGNEERVITKDLKEGMELEDFDYPENFIHGNDKLFSNIHEHAKECNKSCEEDDNYNMIKFNFIPKYMVPINFTDDIKMEWLSALFEDASIEQNTFIYRHHDNIFIRSVQLLLTLMNVHSQILFESGNNWKLCLDKENVSKMCNKGFIMTTESMNQFFKLLNSETRVTIKNLVHGYNGETFCFNEPYNHTGVFNGILTGQSEMYSLMIDYFIKDTTEKHKLFNAVENIPCIKKKTDWALKWIEDRDASFAQRLVAFACVEGIFFSGAFCAIFWLKERGILPGLCLSNEFISRDEGLHTEFAVLLYNMLNNKLDEEIIHDVIKDAVEIEDEFINESIPCNLLGMNGNLMSQYIRFVADRLVVQLGYNKIWRVQNPFDFMDRIGLDGKDNFFDHTRNSNYARANIGGESGQSTNNFTFKLDEEF